MLRRLSKEVGWHHYDTITELKGKRKAKAHVSYEINKQLEKLREKEVELAEKQLTPEMDKIKLTTYWSNSLTLYWLFRRSMNTPLLISR